MPSGAVAFWPCTSWAYEESDLSPLLREAVHVAERRKPRAAFDGRSLPGAALFKKPFALCGTRLPRYLEKSFCYKEQQLV
ncbi:MAG: hypothetical protein D6741_15755, partial [Planctomycetota bacterium]